MGGTITLVPDNYIPSLTRGWVVGGGGTLVTAVNDANDATYVTDTTPSGAGSTRISWHFANGTMPTGAAIKYTYPVIRNSQASGNRQLHVSIGTYYPPDGISYQSPAKVWTPTSTITNTSGTAAGTVPQSRSQDVLNLLFTSVLQYPSGAFAEDHRIYRVEAKVVYVDSPLADDAALYPLSGNTLTSRPGVEWSFNSTDGLTQYEYRVALWKLTDINLHSGGRAGFEAAINDVFVNSSFTGTDALPHSPVWRSGGGANGSWVVGTETNATPDVDLAGTGQYVYYIQVSALHSGERLAHPTAFESLDFTMALTVPAAPSSVVATWERDFQFQTRVVVTVPSVTLGAWTGRRIEVERKIVGAPDSSYILLPLGVQEAGAGAGSVTFFDTLPAVGRSLQYRAKTVLWSSAGYTSASTYTTSGSILADFVGFVLRNPLDEGSAVVFRILGDFQADEEAAQGQFRPLASELPVVVSDAVLGRVWHVQVRVKDTIVEAFLNDLRRQKTPLVLHTDMIDTWYWVQIGSNVQKTTLRQTDRRDPAKREQVWQMDLIEVNAPPGQPQTYF